MNIQEEFEIAAEEGNLLQVAFLLKNKKINPCTNKQLVLREACTYGMFEMAELLLNDPRINPSYNHNAALFLASMYGHIEIVKLILKDNRVNPSDKKNRSIEFAYNGKCNSIVDLLWKYQCVKDTLENDHPKLYDILKKEDLKSNIKSF